MYINGKALSAIRQNMGMEVETLAEYLTMDVTELESYEAGELWYEEDMFRLSVLAEIMDEYDYMLDGEYKALFEELGIKFQLYFLALYDIIFIQTKKFAKEF